MANTKISALTPGAPAVGSTDLIPIARSGSNFSLLVNDILALATPWSAITAAAANLTLANGANTTTFQQTSNVAWLWQNTALGTGSSTNSSPLLQLAANFFNGASSLQDTWTIASSLTATSNAPSTLSFTHSGSGGNAYVAMPSNTASLPGLIFGTDTGMGFGSAGVNELRLYVNRTQMQVYNQTDSIVVGAIGTNSSDGSFRLLLGSTNHQMFVGGSSGFQNAYTTNNIVCLTLGATAGVAFQGTTAAGLQSNIDEPSTFSPASGSTAYVAHSISPVINQTSSATGSYTALKVNVTETAVLGSSNKLMDLQIGTVSKFALDNTGKIIVPSTNTATSATLGANGAVPAQVTGYLIVNIAGTNQKIPYFNV